MPKSGNKVTAGDGMEIAMKQVKERISLTIDSDLLEKIKALAEADDRSLSQFINLILRDYVRKLDGQAK